MTLDTLDEVQAAYAALPEVGDRNANGTVVAIRTGWWASDDSLGWGGAHALLLRHHPRGVYFVEWLERGPAWEPNRVDDFPTLSQAAAVFDGQYAPYAEVGERVLEVLHAFEHPPLNIGDFFDADDRAAKLAETRAALLACPRCRARAVADPYAGELWADVIDGTVA